ncbi:MAG: thioesterase family protein [bacterium]|nr:thioesterase family protein [bacterium]
MVSEFYTTRRIEFPDTDMAGIVHFSRFFVFMEAAEHEFLRSLGTSVSTEWNGNKIGWPRLAASCDYVSPARFEDVLDIRLTVVRKGGKSMTYGFEFTRDETEIARGMLRSVCCICNPGEAIRSMPIPDFIADQIQEAPEQIEEGVNGAES